MLWGAQGHPAPEMSHVPTPSPQHPVRPGPRPAKSGSRPQETGAQRAPGRQLGSPRGSGRVWLGGPSASSHPQHPSGKGPPRAGAGSLGAGTPCRRWPERRSTQRSHSQRGQEGALPSAFWAPGRGEPLVCVWVITSRLHCVPASLLPTQVSPLPAAPPAPLPPAPHCPGALQHVVSVLGAQAARSLPWKLNGCAARPEGSGLSQTGPDPCLGRGRFPLEQDANCPHIPHGARKTQ